MILRGGYLPLALGEGERGPCMVGSRGVVPGDGEGEVVVVDTEWGKELGEG